MGPRAVSRSFPGASEYSHRHLHCGVTAILSRQNLAWLLKSMVPVSSLFSAAAAFFPSVACVGELVLVKTDLPKEITRLVNARSDGSKVYGKMGEWDYLLQYLHQGGTA